MHLAGFVLVGGASSRMGRDKALLQTDNRTLVETVAEQVAKVAGSACLVGSPQRYQHLPFECLTDHRAGCGPLGGIETVLMQGAELNLIIACDMPGVQTKWLEQLIAQAESSNHLCTISEDSLGAKHPFCAVWKKACLPLVQSALDRHQFKMFDLLRSLDVQIIRFDEPLHNVNTPADWVNWQTIR